jgi:hypothetical protein
LTAGGWWTALEMMMIFEEDAAPADELCIVHLFKPCSLFDAHFLPISLCEELKLLDHLRALNMYDLVCLAYASFRFAILRHVVWKDWHMNFSITTESVQSLFGLLFSFSIFHNSDTYLGLLILRRTK